MPYINLKTNVNVENPDALQHQLGEVIRLIPGKTPERTMILIDSRQTLYFAGSGEPCAMVETQVNAPLEKDVMQGYCMGVIDLLAQQLGIPENRIYVNVNATDHWAARR